MNFKIPKLSDRQLVNALCQVQLALKPMLHFQAHAALASRDFPVQSGNPEKPFDPGFEYDYEAQALETADLRNQAGVKSLTVIRQSDQVCDQLTLNRQIPDHVDQSQRAQFWFTLAAAAQREFRVADTVASFQGHEDTAWNRFRDAQIQVLASLQATTETLLATVAKRNAELDQHRDEKYAQMEAALRELLAGDRASMEKQIADQKSLLGQREKQIAEREAAFETKDARYVARKNQADQMKQIQDGLKDWHLTKGTQQKRWPIFWGYVGASLVTAALTAYSVFHSYDLIKTAADLALLQWWQWLALTCKTLFPLAAFTTFIISFIRWSSHWAQQHAQEEFRNRALLVDIGRSSWLLEAVRDSHEGNKDIPPDLLKELAKNLFNGGSEAPPDSHPRAGLETLLQGLSSIRVKSPDGAEVEAKRGK